MKKALKIGITIFVLIALVVGVYFHIENIQKAIDDTTRQTDEEVAKIFTCANQGESFDYTNPISPNECCDGLIDVDSLDSVSVDDVCYWDGMESGYPGGICSDCGNGICEDAESVCGCAEDCVGVGNSDYNNIQEFCDNGYELYCSSGFESELCDLCL